MDRGWLGVDIGTTSTKAVVYDDLGVTLGQARTPTEWTTTAAGTEIDPDALFAGALDAMNRAVDSTDRPVQIAGVGLASMGETGVLVDADAHPVAAAVAWHDTRDEAEVVRLGHDIGRSSFEERTGKPLRSQFSLTKHRWLLDHDASVGSADLRLNVAEWVAFRLGAEPRSELSLASRTGWFDLFAGDWDDELLAWSGASRSLLPPLVRAGEPIGAVTSPQAHARLRGAVVTLCGHDHQAAVIGSGAEGADDELDSSGTAEALVRTIEPRLRPAEVGSLAAAGITVDASVQPHRWSILGGTQGGLVMQRALAALGVTWQGLAELDAAARVVDPVGDELAADVAGGTLTLRVAGDVSPGLIWRAVVEAVTREAAELHDAISAVAGPHHRLVVAGGWRASTTVMDAKRRHLGELMSSPAAEPGTLGAAVLAARAAGRLASDETFDRSSDGRTDDPGRGAA